MRPPLAPAPPDQAGVRAEEEELPPDQAGVRPPFVLEDQAGVRPPFWWAELERGVREPEGAKLLPAEMEAAAWEGRKVELVLA